MGATRTEGRPRAELLPRRHPAIVAAAVRNNAKTNTSGYNAVKVAYDASASPAVVYGLSSAPGGGALTPIYGAVAMFLTSPTAKDVVATASVGPKDGGRSRPAVVEGGRQGGEALAVTWGKLRERRVI